VDIATIPLREWAEATVLWCTSHGGPLFALVTGSIDRLDAFLRAALRVPPPALVVLAAALWALWRRGIPAAVAVALGLLLIWNLALWKEAIDTVSLVLIAAGLSLAIGIPVGILMAESATARSLITPILDYMQTTPAFVYLIPSVLFFGIGTVPGVLATMMFALPPPIRATMLGIANVPPPLIEAGNAFGATPLQLIVRVKLPLALPYVSVGVNQCIMMSLSMVVIASLVGARGLGTKVVESLTQADLAKGIEAGLAVVATAITLDLLSRPRSSAGRGSYT
jgi:ABC-type proline/glycine betaine transport system permease subunit